MRISDRFALKTPVQIPAELVLRATASGGGDHLVVCVSHGWDAWPLQEPPEELHAVVVRDGQPLVVGGTALGPSTATAFATRAGAGWLVVADKNLFALDADGAVRAKTTLPFTAGGIAWGNDRALVTSDGGQGQLVSADGALLDAAFTIPTGPKPVTSGGSVAFDGAHFLVEYLASGIALSSVTPAGKTTGPVFAFDATGSGQPLQLFAGSVVTDGHGFLLDYAAPPPTCGYGGSCTPVTWRYRTASVRSNGQIVLGSALTAGSPYAYAPSLTYANGTYVANMVDFPDGYRSLLIDSKGVATDNEPLSLAGYASLAASPDGQSVLGVSRMGVQRLDSAFEPLDAEPAFIVTAPAPQVAPSAVFDGTAFAVTWSAAYGQPPGDGARIAPDGSHGAEWPFMSDGSVTQLAASNGTTVLGSSYTESTATTRLLGPSGATEVDGLPLGNLGLVGPAASDGSGYLAVGVAANQTDLFAVVISDAGVASPSLTLPGYPSPPVFDGESYVLLFGSDPSGLTALRISPNGTMLDPTPAPLGICSCDRGSASNGDGSLLAWVDYDTDAGDYVVMAAHLTRSLELEPPAGYVLGHSPWDHDATVLWDGINYVVFHADPTVWVGWRVAPDGQTVLDSFTVPLEGGVFSANRAGDVLIIASSTGVFGRWVSEGVPVATGGTGAGGSAGTETANGGEAGSDGAGTGGRGGTGGTHVGRGGSGGDQAPSAGSGGSRNEAGAATEAAGAPGSEGGEGGVAEGGRGSPSGGRAPNAGRGAASHGGNGGLAGSATTPDRPDDGACSCRVVSGRASERASWLGLFGLGLALRRRRRRKDST